METGSQKDPIPNTPWVIGAQHVLFAESPPGITIGVVSDSEPSSLALLAAGVAGIAARRARRERMKSSQAEKRKT
jgi:hypothetical protein